MIKATKAVANVPAIGKPHVDCLVLETVEHYHEERPHQSLGIEPLVNRKAAPSPGSDTAETKLGIVCRERLKHYALRAA